MLLAALTTEPYALGVPLGTYTGITVNEEACATVIADPTGTRYALVEEGRGVCWDP
jgi:hypothetical protein